MKKLIIALISLALVLSAGCASPDTTSSTYAQPSATVMPSPTPSTDEALVEAAASVEDLRGLISRFTEEGNNEAKYHAAMKLMELDPSATDAYMDAATALYLLSEENMIEINRLLALGLENAQYSELMAEWAQRHQPDFSIDIPYVSDYGSEYEINTADTTPST